MLMLNQEITDNYRDLSGDGDRTMLMLNPQKGFLSLATTYDGDRTMLMLNHYIHLSIRRKMQMETVQC